MMKQEISVEMKVKNEDHDASYIEFNDESLEKLRRMKEEEVMKQKVLRRPGP